MNDDIFERLIKSVGILLGGYFVMYLMIITTQKHEDDQKHFSELIMKHIRKQRDQDQEPQSNFENVIRLRNVKTG